VSGLTCTVRSTGTCFRKFKYRWRAATYSLTFLSSASVLSRRVFYTSKLCFHFDTALVGLCKRLCSLLHSSTSISFLADCIISETCYPESTTLEAVEQSETRPFVVCDVSLSTTSSCSPELWRPFFFYASLLSEARSSGGSLL